MPVAKPLPLLQEGQQLNGLAETHVVGEASAEAEFLKELQPADPFALVGAELVEVFLDRVAG